MNNIKFKDSIKYVVDTNILYSNLNELDELDKTKLVIIGAVLRELNRHKTCGISELEYNSRVASRWIKANKNDLTIDAIDHNAETILGVDYANEEADNRIVSAGVNYGGIISNDLNVQFKAEGFDVDVIAFDENENLEDNYKGFIEVEMTQDEYREFHDELLDENNFDLLLNQYLIIYDKDSKVDKYGKKKAIQSFKWNGEYLVHIKSKTIKSVYVNNFSARDEIQACAIDSVVSNKFTILRGGAGVAKTQIAISYLLQQLHSNKIDKILIIANTPPSKDAHFYGLTKGDLNQKIMQSSIANILASKLGSYEMLEMMLAEEKIVILPASDIRGLDTTGMNAGILLTEAQNWSRELLKLAIQRVGETENSNIKMIIEGDRHTQIDLTTARGRNNGMLIASEVFRGQPYFGEVALEICYRSEICERAELMSLGF